MTYDLYAEPAQPVASTPVEAAGSPAPPSVLWGIAWRLLSVELLALTLAGDVLPWIPAGTLPLSLAAIATWGLPLGLWRRAHLGGALWRVLATAALLAVTLGRPAALVAGLAAAFMLCVGEPLHAASRRHRLAMTTCMAADDGSGRPGAP